MYLQVVRLWDYHRLQRDSGKEDAAAIRDPPKGSPVEGRPLYPGVLELRVLGGIEVQFRELEGDSPGGFVKTAERCGHPGTPDGSSIYFLVTNIQECIQVKGTIVVYKICGQKGGICQKCVGSRTLI